MIQLKNPVRIVTAASLFDGHDVSINIMRRIMQSSGAEVIHLGHNRSVNEIVDCAIQEDVQAIAITSYQGGHVEYFKYMYDLLQEKGAGQIKIFGGGGGTILPEEIEELHQYGISGIYSPDDGRKLGLQGMIAEVLKKSDFALKWEGEYETGELSRENPKKIARLVTLAENRPEQFDTIFRNIKRKGAAVPPVLGITGTGGAGKSSLVDELVRRFLADYPNTTIAIVSVDPSRRKSGGALLGDRIRMNAIDSPRVYMRSLATRQSHLALSKHINKALAVVKAAGFDLVILESSGIGQSDTEIADVADHSLYVMTPEYGAASQLEKIDMIDFADFIAINKFDKKGAEDALRDVRKQYKRNRQLWETPDEEMPVFDTMASQFNDRGMNRLYRAIEGRLFDAKAHTATDTKVPEVNFIIPPARTRYLAEIAETIRDYNKKTEEAAEKAEQIHALSLSKNIAEKAGNAVLKEKLEEVLESLKAECKPEHMEMLEKWPEKKRQYSEEEFIYLVRGKEVKNQTFHESLAKTKIPVVALPKFKGWGDILRWQLQENVPGEFPFTAGVYPFKRKGEDPTRMFAGEGGPERTNRRFHYLSSGQPATRLSTAFDSVTLYGEDPGMRPDIYGKIGNAGVSICCLDDAKKLYSGFDLTSPKTSVSMTINGPAATMTAFFMNAAIDQQCELHIRQHGLEGKVEERLQQKYDACGLPRPGYFGELPQQNQGLGLMLLGVSGSEILEKEAYEKIKEKTLSAVRGTVQADILKEDQAQNTCIFSTEFSLRLMGDVQQYFIQQKVQNFYSVSVSGYHIAEAGANPITQLAFTLANGFTYVEYYASRGMKINKFVPNLSFFFSNGIDPEYAVIGRVARRIWAKAMKYKYGADVRSQMLKYHIQTSGRSLHAQEIHFNDIRTTLQALYAIYDNCNSLHTNAYDEAITTPTEDSVRRAMAIQLIINQEFGLTENENPLQGSFIIEELTDLVEEAVLVEFDRLSDRGGVLGAMETMYQRSKIQEESFYYETLKHSGEYPIVGVNTFLSSKGSPTTVPGEVIRATREEKEKQIEALENLHQANAGCSDAQLKELQAAAVVGDNLFEKLMEAAKYCSLGQITHALFEVGGQYRRNM